MKKEDKKDFLDVAFISAIIIAISLMPMAVVSFMQELLKYNVSSEVFNYVGGTVSALSGGAVVGLIYLLLDMFNEYAKRKVRKNANFTSSKQNK